MRMSLGTKVALALVAFGLHRVRNHLARKGD